VFESRRTDHRDGSRRTETRIRPVAGLGRSGMECSVIWGPLLVAVRDISFSLPLIGVFFIANGYLSYNQGI